jgi:hypothetical protein
VTSRQQLSADLSKGCQARASQIRKLDGSFVIIELTHHELA